jgi:regulator of sirC expression with transglutaminase-like and TPR domain
MDSRAPLRTELSDSTFEALIRLLDDNDPVVASHVEEELIRLGTSGIERLEKAWEKTEDNTIQGRLEELITRIQTGHFTQELYDWRMGGGGDLLEGWLTLTQLQYPTLNGQKYRNEINRLVNRAWLLMHPSMNDLERLSVVNKLLYSSENYNGNYKDPERPENSHLSFVIDAKKGNSLAMASLYYIVCQQLDIHLQVVNFMGYYALRYYQPNSHFYIDSYNKGMFFTPQQVTQFLKKLKAESNVNTYKPLSNIYIILQMIEHLKTAHRTAEQHEKLALYEQLERDIDVSFARLDTAENLGLDRYDSGEDDGPAPSDD